MKTLPSATVSWDTVRQRFGDSPDLVSRRVAEGAVLCFLDGLVSQGDLTELLKPLAAGIQPAALGGTLEREAEPVFTALLGGYAALLTPAGAWLFEVKAKENRAVDLPKEEKVVGGPKDAFVETLRTNTALLRKRLRTPDLRLREYTLGERSRTRVALLYLEGFTKPELVEEAERRLLRINCEAILSAASLAERLCDRVGTPFPQLLVTERPDKVCTNLLEGRVAILAEGLPMGFLAPATFSQFFKVPEDDALHFLMASFLTLLRYFSLLLAAVAPAFYVAVALHHREMIPMELMQSMISAKQEVPFPTAFEVLAMLLAFDLLQEAGIRLPSPVGQTVSIIGALIVGQSAVEARVVSPVVVVVIALAGIAGYTMPSQDMAAAVRIVRLVLVIPAIFLGLYGIVTVAVLITWHLADLTSFGFPYMTPFAGNGGRHRLRALLRFSMPQKKLREEEILP